MEIEEKGNEQHKIIKRPSVQQQLHFVSKCEPNGKCFEWTLHQTVLMSMQLNHHLHLFYAFNEKSVF